MTFEDTSASKIKLFYTSLQEEKATFRQPLSNLLLAKIVVTHEEENQVIGLAGITKNHMFFLVVKSSHQNKGIGQSLARKIIREAIKRNCSHIALYVNQLNNKAVYIYKKLGFRPLYYLWEDNQTYLYMILPLNFTGMIIAVFYKIVNMIFSKIDRKSLKSRKIFSLWNKIIRNT